MSWTAPLRSPGAMHRLTACVLALVWGTAPVLVVLHGHSSVEVHRYCAQHRALEDVAGVPGLAPASDVDTTAVRGAEAAQPHSGCAFVPFGRSGRLVAQFVLQAARLVLAPSVPGPGVATAPARIAVIVVAPKTSPPV